MRNKKKWKQLTALLLSAAMLVPAHAVYAAGGQAAGSEMEIYEENRAADADGFVIEDGVLINYVGTATEVVIPDGVTSIGNGAFGYCSGLTSIKIPEGVTSIGDSAFYDCSGLTSITIPEGVTNIGYWAFTGCSGLTSITIPESMESIGGDAFADCSGLTSITIPKGVTFIERRAFLRCSGLTSIEVEKGNPNYDSRENCNAIIETKNNMLMSGCKNTVIPTSVASIGGYAFAGCSGLINITIPEGVTSIEGYAFLGCSGLTSITIPESVTSIRNPFVDCGIGLTIYGKTGSYAEIYAKENNIKFSSTGEATKPVRKKTISANNVTVSPISYAYDGKAKKPAVTVKEGDTVLKAGTDYTVSYDNNTNAGTAKVTVTGKGNYEGTVTKTFIITVRKGTSHVIGAYKYQVTGKSTVSVTGISDKKTVKVKIPKTVTIGGKTFKVASIGKNVFKKNMKITSVEIGDNVKTIGASAFEGCAKLAKVTLGKGVTEIGSSIFKNCKKLGTITIKSASLKKVGKNALKGIKATAKIKVPKKKLSVYKKLLKNKGQGKNVRITK